MSDVHEEETARGLTWLGLGLGLGLGLRLGLELRLANPNPHPNPNPKKKGHEASPSWLMPAQYSGQSALCRPRLTKVIASASPPPTRAKAMEKEVQRRALEARCESLSLCSSRASVCITDADAYSSSAEGGSTACREG